MTMFTTYIYVILNYSSFTPCSCGGVLEKMSWTEHLLFNIVFILLSGLAIIVQSNTKFTYGYLIIYFFSGISTVVALFLLSEDIIEHRNNFVRRLPDQVHKAHDTNLDFNSYYFAGAKGDKLYLGNVTSPLLLTIIDTAFKTKKEVQIKINKKNLPFRSLQIQVQSKFFFVSDGTVPCLFRGKTNNWTAEFIPLKNKPFSNPVFIDSSSLAYRTRKVNGESVLGTTYLGNQNSTTNPQILQKQIDGIFDVDGNLLFDSHANKLVYLYYYRNQFIVTDPKLQLKLRGKTIDTISKAQIKVAFNQDRNERKLSAPPLMVNKNGFAYKGLLFVHSALMGQFEDTNMWSQASLIDVYDIQNNSYIVSFYVYHIEGKKLRRFLVSNNNFYALIGTHLVSYKLSDRITNRYTKTKI